MKLEKFTFRQVTVAVLILGLANWAVLQYALLPRMTNDERKAIYSGWMSTPYPYLISIVWLATATWFLVFYHGRFTTHSRRIAVFGMTLGAMSGLLLILVIRIAWHI